MKYIIKPIVDEAGVLRLATFDSNESITPIEISKRKYNCFEEIQDTINFLSQKNSSKYIVEKANAIKNLIIMPVAYEKLKSNYVLEKYSVKGNSHVKNEDSIDIVINNDNNSKLLLVADGVGGEYGGEIASKYTLERIKSYFQNYTITSTDKFVKDVKNEIKKVSNELSTKFFGRTPCTTLVMAALLNNQIITFNIGDSRCYGINNNNQIELLTEDQSMVWKKYIKNHTLSDDDLRFVCGNNIILSCIGDSLLLNVEVKIFNSSCFSSLILCSDGVSDVLSKQELEKIVLQENTNIAIKIITAVRNKNQHNTKEMEKVVSLLGVANGNVKDDDASVVVMKRIR